jgi:predicted PurR-regulated permease PerM
MSEKKMVSRSVAIALGLVCIVLIAFIAYFTVTGISAQNSYNNLQNQNKQLQTWLEGNITSLQSQINNLTNIVNLANSTVWVNDQTVEQGAGSFNTWTETANYAGYVVVWVSSSAVVEVIYSAYGASFNQTQVISGTQVISAGYTAVFPLLPCSDITVGVGNVLSSATEIVTITYYY